MFLRIDGVLHYLWRAMDQHGVVLDILVQDRRDATVAKRCIKRLLAPSSTGRGVWSPMACVATASRTATSCPTGNAGLTVT